jgi:hypothetical protein
MAKVTETNNQLEPEIEEFLSLLANIAARLLTKSKAERENDPAKGRETENESSSVRKSQQ